MELRLENLTKIFTNKTGTDTRAVDDLSITIESGTLVGLLGPSGCGKSTTLFMIAGLLKPTSGKIFFGDDDVTKLAPEKRGIGLVFQNYALYPHMTVYKNIMFPLENMDVPRDEAIARVKEMANLVGIGTMLDRKPAQLSGGQQQRVAIARALVKKPRVLLLDEPLSNLDARLRLQMREEIKRIQRETGITTVFVTHDQEEAMSISDKMVVLNFGVEQQYAAPQIMYNEPANLFVAKFLGNPPINTLEADIKNGYLMINDQKFMKFNVKDGSYMIGMRPEHFRVAEKNSEEKVKVDIKEIFHVGRDTMIHFELNGQNIRALVDSDSVEDNDNTVELTLRRNRIYIFDKDTGKVIDHD
ncbi:MAG: ABC transporter ATP-binding protein [Candidatus Izemoplasmatales bacterium]|uniref:ABC transporter ATP-binding protein n=1 Tax=Hujiaoplasma nucleasis TaxID=2725268 RepID=A0A7L6N4D6_9MOLU|nr:ABC transporter ATP-binding protein [Hujiaoplasma nucleasis]QLY40421.1 ABC transporter ATP-binding protein [Hujiaoplasma nucleasis]